MARTTARTTRTTARTTRTTATAEGTKSSSMLWPTLWMVATRIWKVRWLPWLTGMGAVMAGAWSMVLWDRRTTFIMQPATATEAADHPWRYAARAAELSREAYATGVRSVLFVALCVALIGATILASKDR